MDKPFVIHVNLDVKCKRCGKGGAMENGLCMNCVTKAIQKGEFDHILKPLRDKVGKKILRK